VSATKEIESGDTAVNPEMNSWSSLPEGFTLLVEDSPDEFTLLIDDVNSLLIE
jgi:hypothetical protein